MVSFSKFVKPRGDLASLSNASVIVDKENIPLGFLFGRNSFISLCTVLDDEFEKRASDPERAYDNPAGRIIDLIEEKLPVNANFAKELKFSIKQAKKSGWISLDKIISRLHV